MNDSIFFFFFFFYPTLRSPPRPSPGSLHYSDEDVSTKYNDLIPAESSSLTEKPSEISDSQVQWELLLLSPHPGWFLHLNVSSAIRLYLSTCARCHQPEFFRNSALHCRLYAGLWQFLLPAHCPSCVAHLNTFGPQRSCDIQ